MYIMFCVSKQHVLTWIRRSRKKRQQKLEKYDVKTEINKKKGIGASNLWINVGKDRRREKRKEHNNNLCVHTQSVLEGHCRICIIRFFFFDEWKRSNEGSDWVIIVAFKKKFYDGFYFFICRQRCGKFVATII